MIHPVKTPFNVRLSEDEERLLMSVLADLHPDPVPGELHAVGARGHDQLEVVFRSFHWDLIGIRWARHQHLSGALSACLSTEDVRAAVLALTSEILPAFHMEREA